MRACGSYLRRDVNRGTPRSVSKQVGALQRLHGEGRIVWPPLRHSSYASYAWDMGEAAAEMPISDARDHLADVVNRAVYAGTPTHLTRRGRRLAVVVSEDHLAEEDARAREEATAAACRAL